MSYQFPPDVQQFISAEVAGGLRSEVELLTEAVRFLQAERRATIEAVQEGLTSMQRGEGTPLDEVDRRMRQKYDIRPDA
jgi:hypothetical protein